MPRSPSSITVGYSELNGSPRESVDDNGNYVGVRELVCEWGDALTLINQIIGTSGAAGGGGASGNHALGQEFPLRAGETNAPRAVAYSLEPFSPGINCDVSDTTVAEYEKAKLTISYKRNLTEDDDGSNNPDTLAEESLEPEAEVVSIGKQTLCWANRPGGAGTELLEVGEFPAKTLINLTWTVTFHRVLEFSDAFINQLGSVNNASIRSGKFNKSFEADTLLYSAFNAHRTFSTDGVGLWRITTRMSHRRNFCVGAGVALGWHGMWRISKADFDRVKSATVSPGGGVTCNAELDIYPRSDFTAMSLQQNT